MIPENMPKSSLSSYEPLEVKIPPRVQLNYLDVSVAIGEYLRDHKELSVDPETGKEELRQPELTNEWVARTFAEFGLETVEEFKDAVWETLNADQDEQRQQLETDGILGSWAERLVPPIAESDVDAIVPLQQQLMDEALAEEFPGVPEDQRLDAYLARENKYAFKPKDRVQFQEDMRSEAKRTLQIARLTEAVTAHENPEITDEALVLAAMGLYGLGPDSPELAAMLDDQDSRDILARQALEDYALEWLVRNTAIVESD